MPSLGGVVGGSSTHPTEKRASFSNLLCYIFPVAVQMILSPGEPGSGAWWGHPGYWLTGSCWRSSRPRHKTRTTWQPPRSERGSQKPWITPPKEGSLIYSVGKNITSRENFICGDHLWIAAWALALRGEMAGELFAFVLFTDPDNRFPLETARLAPHTMLVIIYPASPGCAPCYSKSPHILPLVLFLTHLCLTATRCKPGHKRSVTQMSFPISPSVALIGTSQDIDIESFHYANITCSWSFGK